MEARVHKLLILAGE